jgi:hypothetical protein
MHPDSLTLIIIGLGLLIGVLIWRATGKTTTIKNVKGNVIGGDANGSVVQSYTGDAHIGADQGSKISAKDLITWLIAIIGLVITGLGVYHAWISGHP